MLLRLGEFVTRRWPWVLLAWVAVAIAVTQFAPPWDKITHDGDFAYLPPSMTSVQAETLLRQAFTQERAKSQIAFIVFRSDAALTEDDLEGPAYDMARRLHNVFGVAAARRAAQLAAAGEAIRSEAYWQRAEESLNEAILLDSSLKYERPATGPGSRWAAPILNRAIVHEQLGHAEEAEHDRKLLDSLAPELRDEKEFQPAVATRLPIMDLWTWRDETFGAKLRSDDLRARLMLLHLTEEFLAVGNVELVRFLQAQVSEVQETALENSMSHLQVGLSGSASVGGDLLIASADSIRHTETFTIILVVAILALVYRSPVLVVVPLITIFLSLRVSTSLVAWLTQLDSVPGFGWWELKVFTTSKIFIVVILFGAGTNFCLFLISRCRELLADGESRPEAIAKSVAAVGDALVASGLTTIVGLSMMVFADFGKFRYSGPIIGLCLLVTLVACLTLTPALLCAVGRWLKPLPSSGESRFWRGVAERVTAQPGRVLALAVILLAPFAAMGVASVRHVTYDFLSSLSPASVSRRGAALMQQSFPVGESGPVMVVARVLDPVLESRLGRDEIARLNYLLHENSGVAAVRSLADPLGETSPEDTAVLLSRDTIEARFARHQKRTAELYLAQEPGWKGRVTRFEVVMKHDPFSPEAVETLETIEADLKKLSNQKGFWYDATFHVAGTTAGIRDLAIVTQRDTRRIEILVVIAVFIVLVALLRRPVLCAYLVASVMFSYFVTVGGLAWVMPLIVEDYQGFDWKVPLFLFVILVAVGQDYNVYLVTRVFEERQQHDALTGLKRAVEKTGGIITSCGAIMAGTFLSMTGGFWSSSLRRWFGFTWLPDSQYLIGIVQLGFALAIGVTIDTLIVRTLLVPAFIALRSRK